MTNKMTKWGCGPRFGLYSAFYCILMFGLTIYFEPLFTIAFIPYGFSRWLAIAPLILGIPFYLFSLVSVMRAFKAGKLVTKGVYGMCRHPVYSAWILFFIPGLALLLNSWALLSASVVLYFLARFMVREEDMYLEIMFGEEYLKYKSEVPAILPYGWQTRHK
ncbi:MAG: methyltransferase family protein [Thermodesulfobacteriota bacterium]